jgi:hypothetical protein
MRVVSPESRERVSHPAQRIIGKCSPVMAVEWSREMSRETPRFGVNIGKRSQDTQPKAGSISGSSVLQSASCSPLRGTITTENDLPAQCPWLNGVIAMRGGHRRGNVK